MENLIILVLFIVASLMSHLSKRNRESGDPSPGRDDDILRDLLTRQKSVSTIAPSHEQEESSEYFSTEEEASSLYDPAEAASNQSGDYIPKTPSAFSNIDASVAKFEDASPTFGKSQTGLRRKTTGMRFRIHSRAELKKAFVLREIVERPRAFDI